MELQVVVDLAGDGFPVQKEHEAEPRMDEGARRIAGRLHMDDLDPLVAEAGQEDRLAEIDRRLLHCRRRRLAHIRIGGTQQRQPHQPLADQIARIAVRVVKQPVFGKRRYEEEEFERLMGRYQIRDGKVHFEKLVIDYEFTTADLRGSLAIADGTLDLSGNVILSKELQDELTGEAKRVEKRVIPIAGVGCTVRRPCIQLDGRAVASVLGTLVSGGELREKLEETIGKEGVGILEQLLRGGNR